MLSALLPPKMEKGPKSAPKFFSDSFQFLAESCVLRPPLCIKKPFCEAVLRVLAGSCTQNSTPFHIFSFFMKTHSVVHVAVHHKFSGQRRAAARGLRQRLSVFHFNPPAFSPAGLPDYVRQLPLSRSQKYKHNSQGKPRFPAKTCPNCYRTTAFPPLPFHRASAKGKTI